MEMCMNRVMNAGKCLKKLSDEELDLLKKNVELFLRRIREFMKDDFELEASTLVDLIRQEGYQIKRWRKPEKYYLIPSGERPYCCYGCGNEHGSCGTPCNNCEKWKNFENEWEMIMMVPDQFYIWKRKVEG